MAERKELKQFLLLVFPLLIPCFALWYVCAAPLALPALGFASLALSSWFPDVVAGLYVQGAEGILMTTFGEIDGRPVPAGASEYQLGVSVDSRIISYSFPFYTALHFATQKRAYLGNYLAGMLVLYVILTIALVSLCLQDLSVLLGPAFIEQQNVVVPTPALIALLYQFSVLLSPTLAPIILWAWQSRSTALAHELVRGKAPAAGNGQA